MANPSPTKPPLQVSGGCLCASICYTITFPATATWPPSRNSTCQCTQCRKHTGSLTPHGITLPTSYFSPPFPANQTLKSYQVTPNSYRSFCSQCGSSLAFNEGKIGEEAEETEIYVGTLDEDVLKGEVGNILGKAKYHCWLKNAVDGVSDDFEEPMYEENMVGKEPMKKKE